MKKEDIVQLKLCNGQDVIACVIEQSEDSFIVNFALDMVPIENIEDEYDNNGKSYYILRPYIQYTEDLERTVSINPFSVISIHTPSDTVVEQYSNSVVSIQEHLGKGGSEVECKTSNVLSFPSKKGLLTED